MNQTANGVISSIDALIDLLESIEQFVNRLDIYTQIPLTPAMIEIMVKIIVELISILALVTKELKQRRSSKRILAAVIPYSVRCSKICKETSRREGRRGGPAEAGPTDTRRGSQYRGRDSHGCPQSFPQHECGHGR
jgi:hypothetical protein